MAGIAFVVAFVLGLMAGIPFLYAVLNAVLWAAIVWGVMFLLSLVFGAGILGVVGIAWLFGKGRK